MLCRVDTGASRILRSPSIIGFNFQGLGHIAYKCPNQIEEDEAKEEDVEEVVQSNSVQEKEEKSSLLSKYELEKEIKVCSNVMALVVVEETKSEKEIPQEIKSILEEVIMEALSRKHALLISMQVKVVGFEMVKDPKVRVKGIKKIHEDVHLKTEKQNAKYVEQENMHKKLLEFEVGNIGSS